MTPIYEVQIFQDHARVRRPGQKLEKPLSIKDLISALCDSAQNVFSYSRSEKARLPKGTYFTEYAGNLMNIAMYFPEHETTVRHGTRSYKIMLPNIVMHQTFKVSNNGMKHDLTRTCYYVTPVDVDNLPSTIPGPLPKIFGHVPFPNFYDNYTMCTGGNSLIHSVEGGDLRIFKMHYDIIEGSPFNNDLNLLGVSWDYDGSYSNWFKKLAEVYEKEKRFPYELLRI